MANVRPNNPLPRTPHHQHVDYQYSEAHIIKAILRSRGGDCSPEFGVVTNASATEFAVYFKLSKNTRLALKSRIYPEDYPHNYEVVRAYLDIPERFTARFVHDTASLPPDIVFGNGPIMILDKGAFSIKIVASPKMLWFLIHESAVDGTYKSETFPLTDLVLPQNPHVPGAAVDAGIDGERGVGLNNDEDVNIDGVDAQADGADKLI